jgi:hypothetical protein
MTDQLAAAVMTTADHERLGYLRCNTLGHAWHDYDSNWKPQFGSPLTVRCERCGMERRDTINNHGDLLTRHYTRPANYRYPKGTRPSRADFRVMLLVQRLHETRQTRQTTREQVTA